MLPKIPFIRSNFVPVIRVKIDYVNRSASQMRMTNSAADTFAAFTSREVNHQPEKAACVVQKAERKKNICIISCEIPTFVFIAIPPMMNMKHERNVQRKGVQPPTEYAEFT